MKFLRLTALLLVSIAEALALASSGAARARAEENNWPIRVTQTDAAGNATSWMAAGPFLYKKPAADGGTVEGFRPLFAEWKDLRGEVRETDVLYPIFTYRTDGETYRWSIFQLINRSGDRSARAAQRLPALTYETFDVWPFWFSRNTHSPESSYHALFPIAGTIKDRLGYDKLSWVLFPFYGRAEKNGAVTTTTPWPFVKITRGTERGFALWPLFGHREKAGAFDRNFYVWPLGWNNTINPADDAPPGTPVRREIGFLPFYSRETAPGFTNEIFLWPFFGYTDRTQPVRYHETRYFWPLLVQGHGDNRSVERWAPFYTHSANKGTEKTWVMWPLYRSKTWTDAGLNQTQRQLFYFIYRSSKQRSASNPNVAPAEKAHLWPLISLWDNGAGRRQLQFPSPLEVFFPDNERVRVSWSPLFALYRFDQSSPGIDRHELFWGFISWRRETAHREFHLGPLFSVDAEIGAKRVAIGNGLIGAQRVDGAGWRFFWFDFASKANKLRATSR